MLPFIIHLLVTIFKLSLIWNWAVGTEFHCIYGKTLKKNRKARWPWNWYIAFGGYSSTKRSQLLNSCSLFKRGSNNNDNNKSHFLLKVFQFTSKHLFSWPILYTYNSCLQKNLQNQSFCALNRAESVIRFLRCSWKVSVFWQNFKTAWSRYC